jgi:hypothetical protein
MPTVHLVSVEAPLAMAASFEFQRQKNLNLLQQRPAHSFCSSSLSSTLRFLRGRTFVLGTSMLSIDQTLAVLRVPPFPLGCRSSIFLALRFVNEGSNSTDSLVVELEPRR